MEYIEIAKQLHMKESAVRKVVSRALQKIAAAGDAEGFATVVQLSQLARGETYIRCGSIECRPEKWVYFL